MSAITFENVGWDITERQLERIQSMLRNDSQVLLIDAATQVVNMAKLLVSISYPPPSSPFNPPHMRTGQLQESIDIQEINDFVISVGSLLDYSFYLEYGTAKMLPRPHLVPAVLEVMKDFPEVLFGQIEREVNRIG